jgi:hypothetical protein
MKHLEEIEGEALREALAKRGLPARTQDFPSFVTEEEAVRILDDIQKGEILLWDGFKVNPAVSKGIPGNSDIHIASMPGSDAGVYNFVTYVCMEDGM